MIKHLLKLLWNRKRASALMVVEIVMSFVVLTAVIGGLAHFTINWQRPLGFDATDVWTLDIGIPRDEATSNATTIERFATLLREVEAMPGVRSAAGVDMPPYSLGNNTRSYGEEGKDYRYFYVNRVTDRFAETMKLELSAGRWFGPEDNGIDMTPVVLNEEAARLYFPKGDAIGSILNPNQRDNERRLRVVGLTPAFRKGGELQSPQPYYFERANLGEPSTRALESIVIRTLPGADSKFEVDLLERLRRVAPEWTFEIRPIAVARRGALRLQFAPLIAAAVIGMSMILLVALGLTGVMWQNVTRRTKEIGLRRALGASSSNVQRQILSETLIVAVFGLIGGLLVVLQAPLSGMLPDIRPEVVTAGIGGSSVMILLIVSVCALYPSRLASSVEPAEALHYE